jgi:hypothetical protein
MGDGSRDLSPTGVDMNKFTYTIHDVHEGTASQFDELYCLHCGHGGQQEFEWWDTDITTCNATCQKCGNKQVICTTEVWNGTEFVTCGTDILCPRCEYFGEQA